MSPSVACKAATMFNVPTASTVGLTSPANGSVGTYCTCILEFVMDVNGDGKSDLVRLWQNGSRTYCRRVAIERQQLHAGVECGYRPLEHELPILRDGCQR